MATAGDLATWRPNWRPGDLLATGGCQVTHPSAGDFCWQPTGDRWRPLATWRPGDLATWRPAGDLLATSAGDLAARSHRRGQRSLAYGVRVRAEGYAYRKVGSCTTARPASEAHYHDRAFHPLVLRQRSNAVRLSPQVKVHTHVTPGQREVFMRYRHACALMSLGCGYPVLLMRLHGRRALIAALGAHAFAHPPSARSGDCLPAPRA